MARSVPPVYPAELTPPRRQPPAFRSARCAVAVAMPTPCSHSATHGTDQVSALADNGQARARLQRQLADYALGHTNDHAFACMIASLCSGGGALPDWLGLEPVVFRRLLDFHFPGADLGDLPAVGRPLADEREDERAEVLALLLMDRAGESPSEVWMAHVVAAGCMASNHLWEDLGLWERATLTALMRQNFPALAARNVRDMKWKRFLYKQLCEAEGIYTCRAPSCEVCRDYHECFENGP